MKEGSLVEWNALGRLGAPPGTSRKGMTGIVLAVEEDTRGYPRRNTKFEVLWSNGKVIRCGHRWLREVLNEKR